MRGHYTGAHSYRLHKREIMSLRNRKRILQKAEAELAETVRGFMLSVPRGSTPQVAQQVYERYNQRWKTYCTNMQKRHKWLQMDASAFEQRVTLLNQQAERKLKPVQYYGKRIMPVVAIGLLVLLLTDVVLPAMGITDYMLFN